MHEKLGSVFRQRFPAFRVLFLDHAEDFLELLQRFLPGLHQRIAASDGWDLCDPSTGLLRVKDDLVVFQTCFAHIYILASLSGGDSKNSENIVENIGV